MEKIGHPLNQMILRSSGPVEVIAVDAFHGNGRGIGVLWIEKTG